jgi:hypothetical protein
MPSPGDLGVLTPASLPAALSAGITQTTVATPGSALTTATPLNVTSKLLQPGTYLVWGNVDYLLTAATASEYRAGLSVVSATLPTQAGGSGVGPDPLSVLPITHTTISDTITDTVGPTILTIAVATTLYLVAQATFSAGTISAFGTLNAMQV